MHADRHGLRHFELTGKIVKVFYEVYSELGYGFLESAYEDSISIAPPDARFRVARQAPIAVWFGGSQVGDFRADCFVENLAILEFEVRSCPQPVR
jgi:GxxExxY protein